MHPSNDQTEQFGVIEFTAVCEWCKDEFVELKIAKERPEPNPMCDKCLNFANEEFSQQSYGN